MKCCYAWVALWACIFTYAQGPIFEQPLSPRIASYRIDVDLQPEHRLLTATQRILWRNTTDHPATELQFHLYLNAFRNDQSTFMKESGGRHRGNEIDGKKGWGFIDLHHLAGRLLTEDETGPFWSESQWPAMGDEEWVLNHEFIQPDDDNKDDKTTIRVPLPEPVPPGGSILLEGSFEACLPSPPFARTGAKEDYFFVGQWFPKIAVLEADGQWNCHQFHLNSEFFADYGTYDVYMTVPSDYVVGSTGLEQSVSDTEDGRKIHHYHAEDVHDFAWTTSPEFVEFSGQAQDVAIRVLMQKDHVGQGERHLRAAKHAVEYFQNWYGDYPFPNLTVIDPRRGAAGSGGMEYPTLITAGTHYGLPEGIRAVELVIIHEFGHNFWYHLLASNEFEETWLDEGINSYTEAKIMNDIYGEHASVIDIPGLKIGNMVFHRSRYVSGSNLDPTVRDAWTYYNGSSYGINSYSKPAIILSTLEHYLGEDKMSRLMKTYVKRHSFTHPTSDDFVAIASEIAGEDMGWFFDQALYTNKVIDYSVSFIKSVEIKEASGFDFSMTRDDLLNDVELDEEEEAADEDKNYRSEVRVRRLGDFVFPVEIEVVFDDGEVVRESWDGQDIWKKFFYERQAKVTSATVDPDAKIPMDINLVNNSKTEKIARAPVTRMTASWLDKFQILLDLLAL